MRVKSERAFLKALPSATHAVAWHFKKEWFARAAKLKVLATPAAGRELVAWRDAPKGVKVHFLFGYLLFQIMKDRRKFIQHSGCLIQQFVKTLTILNCFFLLSIHYSASLLLKYSFLIASARLISFSGVF